MTMNDETLLRYSRQIMLPRIDVAGQQRLFDARVLIIGVGGLGSPVALYLAGCGVGEIHLADPDRVDSSNLPRQIAHVADAIGESKVASARRRMLALNPDVTVRAHAEALHGEALDETVAGVDLVLDCTDNLEARKSINRACFAAGKPLVSAAAIRWEGQISVFDARQPDCPCYECLYGALGGVADTCSENGVMGPVVGMLGCMQASEAVKLLCGVGESLAGRLLLIDALAMRTQEVRLPRDPACPVCGKATGPG